MEREMSEEPKDIKLTDEQKKTLDEIVLSLGHDNWSLITFTPEGKVYNAYSQLDDSNALYSLLLIMREMILNAVNQMNVEMGSIGTGNC